MSGDKESETGIVVVMPIYDDWESAVVLVERIHAALETSPIHADFLLVDDASTVEPPTRIELTSSRPARVEVLRLRRNLGHQRAIAIGLSYLREHRRCQGAVVMDGDGEDPPEGVLKLLERFVELDGALTVFAQRARRTEGVVFKISYMGFKLVHWIFTGYTVKVGNFSVIPMRHIDRLVAVPELWNHYAASIFKARLPYDMIPVDRAKRIAGESRMNFVSLVAHGLSATSVFADIVGLRLLLATFSLALVALSGVVVVLGVRFYSNIIIPGWATTTTGVLVVILLQALLMAFVFVFITLQGRNTAGFLPIRDYVYFVLRVDRLVTDGEER